MGEAVGGIPCPYQQGSVCLLPDVSVEELLPRAEPREPRARLLKNGGVERNLRDGLGLGIPQRVGLRLPEDCGGKAALKAVLSLSLRSAEPVKLPLLRDPG